MSTEEIKVNTEDDTTQVEAEVVAVSDNIKRNRTIAIGVGITAFAVIAGIGAFYFARANHFQKYYYSNTIINGIHCGEQDSSVIENQLLNTYQNYVLNVKDYAGNIVGSIPGDAIGVCTELSKSPKELLAEQDSNKWLLEEKNVHEYQIECNIAYQKDLLEAFLEDWELLDESKMTSPQDAYIGAYDFEQKKYVIVPDEYGTKVDVDLVKSEILEALDKGDTEVSIADAYISAAVREDNKNLTARLDRLNQFIRAEITYDWNGNSLVVDSDLIHDWLIRGKGSITLDQDKVSEFIHECAEQYDTYGKDREFTTIDGEKLVLPGGAYGWQTDETAETEELCQLVLSGSKTEKEPIYSSEARAKGKNDIGDSYVEIDLTNQHLYVWIEGNVELESDLVSGCKAAGNSTPPGVFGVTYKARNATLKGPTWNSFVYYWMPFNKSIGMHDATWRKAFGGDIYLNSGSHGCVNLPKKVAAEIFGYVSKGFPVVCYYLPEKEVEEGDLEAEAIPVIEDPEAEGNPEVVDPEIEGTPEAENPPVVEAPETEEPPVVGTPETENPSIEGSLEM